MLNWDAAEISSIGQHARLRFEEVEKTGSSRPLEFPSPTIYRGQRIGCTLFEGKSGQYKFVKNVLVRVREREMSNSCDSNHSVVGYYLKRKLTKTTHGCVYKAVEIKRRLKFSHENIALNLEKSWKSSSLTKIYEDDEWSGLGLEGTCTNHALSLETEDYIWEPTGRIVAVKTSSWGKIGRLRGLSGLEDPIKEVQAMQLLGDYHPNVAHCIDALQDDAFLYTILPYYKDGDLYGFVMDEISGKRHRLRESSAKKIFKQFIDALYHFQQKGVCHRDLSLDNIVLHNEMLRIIDFGLALRVPYLDPGNVDAVTDVSEGTSRLLISAQGQGTNFTYMAPEVVAREPVFDGFSVDLWAAGVILYIMLIGHKPFEWAHSSDEQFIRLAVDGCLQENLEYWNIDLSDSACDLLQNMLWKNKHHRLSLAEVMEHSWIVKVKD